MAGRSLVKLLAPWCIAGALLAPPAATSFADGTGRVVTYHLNATVAGRGSCVRTNPALSGNGWACVWYNNQLYRELNDLLRDAYINGKTCTIIDSSTDDFGNGIISLAECD